MSHLTAAHITHEACEKIGGIGTVLEGFVTSPVYQQYVKRTIIVGPYANHLADAPTDRLGDGSKVLYSTIDSIDELGLGGKLHPIEWAFNVAFIYGRRRFQLPGSEDHTGEAEVLLIDVFNVNKERVNQFKKRLHEVLGINSIPYESDWGYEEYVRMAEPAYYALLALLKDDELPCMLFSHEFMGLPTAFKCTLDGQKQFRTAFHAHECSTARHLVENHEGHDTAFYNILRQAREKNLFVDDVFGDRSAWFRHALISRAHMCDAIIAVGGYTAKEMHFLGNHFDHHHIDLVYNGVPPLQVDFDRKMKSRHMLAEYSERVVGFTPEVLMTHVMRPVISKGLWRDLQVCHELESRFAKTNQRGVLYVLTSAGGTRRSQDIRSMETEYQWPRHHREGYPDLVGPEIEFDRIISQFNASHKQVQVVLVNQFGWSQELVGARVPKGMTFADFRRATDVEFGMATYEPFGISPLEPLGSGAICVISNVCGCAGFVAEAANGESIDNVLIADYTQLSRNYSIEELLRFGQRERDPIERQVAVELADELVRRLPRDEQGRRQLLERGQSLLKRMDWDHVLATKLIPMLQRVMAAGPVSSDERQTSPKARLPKKDQLLV